MAHKSYIDILKQYKAEDLPEFSEIELVEVDQRGNFGNTPLHVACVRGSITEVKLLFEAGANIDAAGELGNTPLHEAIGQSHLNVVSYLIELGARTDIPNDFGDTAKRLAIQKDLNIEPMISERTKKSKFGRPN
ncbi:ankyrin repeat domain-containing protein [Sphingomonas sp. NCPPB 2930]